MAKIKRGGTHNTAKFTCSQTGIFLEYGLEHWDDLDWNRELLKVIECRYEKKIDQLQYAWISS